MEIPLPKNVTLASHANVVRWLLNLLTHPEAMEWFREDPMRFAALYAALRPYVHMPQALETLLMGEDREVGIRARSKDIEEWKQSDEMPVPRRMGARYLEMFWEGTKIAALIDKEPQAWQDALAEWVTQATVAQGTLNQKLSEYAESLVSSSNLTAAPQADLGSAPVVLFRTNLALLTQVAEDTRLTLHELHLLELAFALAEDESLRMFFDVLSDNARAYHAMLPLMLDTDRETYEALISPTGHLATIHLVQFDRNTRRLQAMQPFWHEWFGALHRSPKDALEKFLVPLKRERNAGALARLPPTDTRLIHRILTETGEKLGTNVLLYGAKSVDKQGWVLDRAAESGVTPYTLPKGLPDQARSSVCFFAQRLLKLMDPKGWLVLPQADAILTRTQRGRHQFLFMELEFDSEVEDSEGEASLLEDNPVPSIWLVHNPERLSENNVGRFLYACELKAASRAERKNEIGATLAQLMFSEDFINELSQHTRVSEQQLSSAASLVMRLSKDYLSKEPDAIAEREALVRQAIEQSQKALNRRQKEDLRKPDTQYSLDLLNVQGAFSVPEILTSLKHRPHASLCFYGLPGTGKTQLAEHIAVELDKPILIKRASDLMDKYVGGNEKNIKKMFEEAQDEDAVLLLDEADSFLRDRTLARNSWEISTVNELLQGMERHRGVFICTTNLFNCLDLASIRRFTFKLQFLQLNENQRWQMFLNESGLDEYSLSEKARENLKMDIYGIQGLAPGDFATIQRQVRLMGLTLTSEQWVGALRSEVQAKMREAEVGMEGPQRF